MDSKVKSIKLRATYESDLSGIHKDLASLKSIRRQLEKTPIRVPLSLDLSGIKSQAVKAAQEYGKAMRAEMAKIRVSSGSGVGAMSAGGIAIPPGAVRDMERFASAAGATFKTVTTDAGKAKEAVTSYEQAMRGVQRITRETKKGSSTRIIDTRPIEDLKAAMEDINKKFAGQMGATKGSKGDLAAVLDKKRMEIDEALKRFSNLGNTAEYRNAEKLLTNLRKQIAELEPKQQQAARKAAEAAASAGATRTVAGVDRAGQKRMQAIKGDISAAQNIRNETMRTQELNRALDAREKLIQRTASAYERLAARAAARGNVDAAEKFGTAARRHNNDLGSVRLDRQRAADKDSMANFDRDLNRRIAAAMREHTLTSQRLRDEESVAKKIKDRAKREAELNRILQERKALGTDTSGKLGAIHREASQAGRHSIADRAAQSNVPVMSQMEAAQRRLGEATRRSAKEVDFHSSSMLKNAATFTQWFIPAQVVMGGFRAIGAGARNAVDAQRTFKVLNAVFRGTREEAELLARQTLQLAAANGRDAQEAAEAAVSWARLGLTRTQVLMVMETSLRAANVAEISTADATKYLTAQYKAFNQTLTEIPGNLDFINSLSNKYNVTPENIFQGIARTATVAKQAGVELRELASIIAIVSDVTGRPGEETGNAMKFILTRIRRPETLNAIKDEFGLDLREPNGDAKKMTDIFGELAALYPSLNRLEKARINDLVAGSRQTERYAVIVDNWTEILIAQANAAMDANSAQRENAEILSSVDAQLQQVSTSWTAFLSALGEVGVFDAVSSFLKQTADELRGLTQATNEYLGLNPKTSEKKSFLNLSKNEKAILNAGDINSEGFGGSDEAFRKRFAASQKNIQSAIEAGESSDAFKNIKTNYERLSSGTVTFKDLEQFYAKFILGQGSTTADNNSQLALDFTQMKGKADGLNAAEKAFRAMSMDATKEGIDPNKMLKQFDDAIVLAEQLEGGLKNVAKARLEIRPLLVSGDREGAKAALSGIADRFAGERDVQLSETEKTRQINLEKASASVESYREKLTKLNELMANADSNGQKAYQEQISVTTDRLKEAEEAQKALNGAIELQQVTAMSADQQENVSKYLADLKLAQETLGETISGFANTGIPEVDQKLRIGGSLLQRDLVRKTLETAQADNAKWEATDGMITPFDRFNSTSLIQETRQEYSQKIAAIQQEKQQREEIVSMLDAELTLIEEATKEVERRLELQRQAEAMSEANQGGRSNIANILGGFAIGASSGERIVNQTRGALNIARGISSSTATGSGDALSDARELGQLSEALSQSKQGLESMEQRMNQVIAERANLEIEITENAKKQREEASKRLALASREDQLRAAAASAALKSRGTDSFSMQEFQFFSQETKGAISNFMPQSVKGLDDTERNNAESRAKLDDELRVLNESISGMRDTFEEVRRMAADVTEKLTRDLLPSTPEGKAIADNKGETRVNLNLGEVVMNFDIVPHISRIQQTLQSHLDATVSSMFSKLREEFSRTGAPNTAPAQGAF